MTRIGKWVGAIVFVGLALGYVWAQGCPASPAYTGPTMTCVDSGVDSFGFGSCAGTNAIVDLNMLSAGDDCGRKITKTHFAASTYTWTLSAPAGCTYTVTYSFKSAYAIGAFADSDNFLDCDEGQGAANATIQCESSITQKSVAAFSSSGFYDEDSDSGIMATPYCQKMCVPTGTPFTCGLGTGVAGQAVSEARGGGNGAYGVPPTFVHSEILCPAGGG